MNSTVAPTTVITSEEGRPISHLQHGLWGNTFSSLFHRVISSLPKQGFKHRSAQTLTENPTLQQGSDCKLRSPSTAVPIYTIALEGTHRSISILTPLLSAEQMKDKKVLAGAGRNTLRWCFLHVLFTSTSGRLLI